MSLSGILIILGTLLGVAACILVVQRFVPHPLRERHNDVAGFIFAAVGVLYAMLLAFVVIAVWENHSAARESTFQEADELAGLYWVSRELPMPLGGRLEQQTIDYAETVMHKEWPLMAEHHSSPEATRLVYELREGIMAYHANGPREELLYDRAVTHLENLASARRERLNQVGEEVPTLLWTALIAGAVITIGFTFLFGLSNTFTHTLMVLMLTGLVVVSLVVIREMDFPFNGATKVDPTAFEVFLDRLPPPRAAA
ncbi:DUF4239 domain-containing protein [Yinghuangia sp. ASG 101]|uniref:bestrophin-like domain n=1 Tax=Yinghuangia sp. ASG 101 TaxID=2896848 RepID=UPI001E4D69EF|nr:DUF4239 domain-containing protein [Yinghuangia sp. ASG 101]UGQ10881.1 DUF4239 domain-containing protein [Yinghuangia sp. ASG 101]